MMKIRGRNIKKAICAFCLIAVSFYSLQLGAAVLHVGDKVVNLLDNKPTSPALGVKIGTNIYYAAMTGCQIPGLPKISSGGITYSISSNNFVLHSEISSINSCASQVLPAGYYKIQLRGGTGGSGGSGVNAGGNGSNAADQEYTFCLTESTTVYSFRGGNGNNGSNGGSSGNGIAAGAGGASGVPSALIVGGTVYKSDGGAGGRGGSARDHANNTRNCGQGGGGGGNSNGGNASTDNSWSTSFHACGAGGGGAPSGSGGGSSSSGSYSGDAGGAGSAGKAGNGGTARRITDNWAGGTGGSSVTWSCGGETFYSYGGGGGGGLTTNFTPGYHMVGAAGGSGSTGASTTSYVRIYRLD